MAKNPPAAAWTHWVTKREELVEKTGISPQDLQILDAFFAPGGEISKMARTHQTRAVDTLVSFASFAADRLA